jgi:hypothetical protein
MRPALSASAQRTPRQALGRVAAVAVTVWLVAAPVGRTAHAADAVTPATCVAANEEAGPLRRAGKLREARARLRLCSAQSCPVAVRKDCVAGAAQTDNDLPTVAFSVQDPDGNDLTAVRISLDGQPLAESLDGKALDVDPGEHVFRFESVGLPTVEKHLVIVEGEKNRRERVQLGQPKAPAVVAPPQVTVVMKPPPASNPERTAGLVVGGSGIILGGLGAVFGLVATLEWTSAKNACGPGFPATCSEIPAANADRAASLRAGYVADVLLPLGGAALITGITLVLLAPTPVPTASTASTHFSLTPSFGPGSYGLALHGAF